MTSHYIFRGRYIMGTNVLSKRTDRLVCALLEEGKSFKVRCSFLEVHIHVSKNPGSKA